MVELIITIVILAIIIAVTIGGIYSYIQKSRINTDINNANSIKKVLSTLSTDKQLTQELNRLETNDVIGIEWIDEQQIKDGKLVSNKQQARVDKRIPSLFIDKIGELLVDGLPSSKTGEPFYITIEKSNNDEIVYSAFSKIETLGENNKNEQSLNIPTIIESHEHILNEKVTKEATCTTIGSKEVKCTKCDYTEVLEIDALGHDYSTSYITDKAATCTEAGSKSQHCSRCNSKQNVTTINYKGHTVVKGATQDIHEKCSVCNVVLSTTHSYSLSVTTQATCTAKGTHTYTCSCGYSYSLQDISALGHNYVWKTDTEATCIKVGTKSQYCSKCNSKINTTSIPATGVHIYVNNTCTGCGDKQYAEVTLGSTYSFGGYYWVCAEMNDSLAVLQSLGVTSGAWPGYVMPQFGNGDYYGSNIDGQDISKYNTAMSNLYNTIKSTEYTSAPYGKGLFLVSSDKCMIDNYRKALRLAAINFEDTSNNYSYFTWLGNISVSSLARGVNSDGNIVHQYQSISEGIAPAFNLDLTKVKVEGNSIIIK